MRTLVRVLCVAICWNLGSTAARAAEPGIPDLVISGNTGQRLWDYCQRLSKFDFNGSVLVARDTQIVLLAAFGVADPRNGTPNTTHTLFSTGSVTKQFTAAAILALESRRKLSVNDRIATYLKGAPADKQDITIHQLLTHSAGFPESLGPDEESISRDSLVALAFATPLEFKPGTSYEYSNVGYSLAAAIVEKVSGQHYEDFMRTLWNQAGLVRTGLYTLDAPESEVARSHNEAMGYPAQTDLPREAWHLIGNGGVLSTPWDLYHWYRWLWNGKGLSAAARQQMFTRQVKEGPMDSYYGYGWAIQNLKRGGDLIWHNGGAMPHGWGCALYHYVNDNLVVVVFSNSTMQGRQPMDFIARGLAQHYLDSTLSLPPVVADSAVLDTATFTGNWTFKDGGALGLHIVGGRLRIEPHGQAVVDVLFPAAEPGIAGQYNALAERLLRQASLGQFDSAGALMDMPPGKSGAAFVQQWWTDLAELGAFKGVDILGTRVAQPPRTHVRLRFERGERLSSLVWMDDRCVAIGPSRGLYLEMLPQNATSFASYDVATGEVIVAQFDGSQLLLDGGGNVLRATREK